MMLSEVNLTDNQGVQEGPELLDDGLLRFGRGFASPVVERQYRDHQLVHDLAQAKLFVTVITAGCLVFVASDYHFLGASKKLLLVGCVRLLLLAGAALTIVVIYKLPTPARFLRVIMAYSVLVAVCSLYIFSTRPPNYLGHAIVDMALVSIFYFVLPLPWRLQLVPALIATVGYLALVWPNLPKDGPTGTALASVMVLINFVGVGSSMLLNYSKRQQFATLRREASLRMRLEHALSEVKTLRGILPICAHCKKVRDDAGYWHQVEAYVTDHTDARFSHGICPECRSVHYPRRS